MKNQILRIEISIAIALVICSLMNISAFSNQCDNIRDKVLRMHVIANSDSVEDQELKLKVRDAVLLKGKTIEKTSLHTSMNHSDENHLVITFTDGTYISVVIEYDDYHYLDQYSVCT